MNRQAEGELAQGVGWLDSATDRRQCLVCGRLTGQVARRIGRKKEGHNTGREAKEWRNGRQLVQCGKYMCIENWDINGIKSDGKLV